MPLRTPTTDPKAAERTRRRASKRMGPVKGLKARSREQRRAFRRARKKALAPAGNKGYHSRIGCKGRTSVARGKRAVSAVGRSPGLRLSAASNCRPRYSPAFPGLMPSDSMLGNGSPFTVAGPRRTCTGLPCYAHLGTYSRAASATAKAVTHAACSIARPRQCSQPRAAEYRRTTEIRPRHVGRGERVNVAERASAKSWNKLGPI